MNSNFSSFCLFFTLILLIYWPKWSHETVRNFIKKKYMTLPPSCAAFTFVFACLNHNGRKVANGEDFPRSHSHFSIFWCLILSNLSGFLLSDRFFLNLYYFCVENPKVNMKLFFLKMSTPPRPSPSFTFFLPLPYLYRYYPVLVFRVLPLSLHLRLTSIKLCADKSFLTHFDQLFLGLSLVQ